MAGINGGVLGPANSTTSGMFTMDEIPFGSRFGGSGGMTGYTGVEFFMLGGGGGRGSSHMSGGGGGGAGEWFEGRVALDLSQTYTVTVGASGGNTSLNIPGIGQVISHAGGNGGSWEANGGDGGSGGGEGGGTSRDRGGNPLDPTRGHKGGTSQGTCGAGGGGAGGDGGSCGGDAPGGTGGAGKVTTFTGVSRTLAAGQGGLGSQGTGANGAGEHGPNTGSGGQSGVAFFRYQGPQRWVGGVVTQITVGTNQYTLHTFNATGTLIAKV